MRVFRKGAHLQIKATVDLGESSFYNHVFTRRIGDKFEIYLSSPFGTKLLSYDASRNDWFEEIKDDDDKTLYLFQHLDTSIIVKPSGIEALTGEGSKFTPSPSAVIFATHHEGRFAVVRADQTGEFFIVDPSGLRSMSKFDIPSTHQVSAMSIFTMENRTVCVLSFWSKNQLAFCNADAPDNLEFLELDAANTAVVRSLCFARFEERLKLFVGFADGSVLQGALQFGSDGRLVLNLSNNKATLGTHPVNFIKTENDIFACSDRLFLITSLRGRINFSLVNAKNIRSIAALATEELILLDDTKIIVAAAALTAEEERHSQLQQQIHRLKNTATRIVHVANNSLYAVIKSTRKHPASPTTMEGGDEDHPSGSYSLCLIDQESFNRKSSLFIPR